VQEADEVLGVLEPLVSLHLRHPVSNTKLKIFLSPIFSE
jgi:hypothetical protein